VGDNGVQFIVGATRTTGAPTSAILEIDPNNTSNSNYTLAGGPTWVNLSAPRLGAAAAWVAGRGLVVAGGSATAPGVEIVGVVSDGGNGNPLTVTPTGSPLAYPPDDTMSAGATALSSATVLLAGGLSATANDATPRTINLACASACSLSPWATSLPILMESAQAFTMSATEAFVVGSELFSGVTHAYTVTSAAVTEIPTKVPHANATAVWSPVGSIAIVGGSELIETFVF
jgi:hypothetical protein